VTSLADIVVAARLVTRDRLAAAEERARTSGDPLVVVLVEAERVAPDAVAAALGRALGRAPLAAIGEIDADAVREVPYDVARARRACPVGLAGDRLRVAMADPTDRETVEALEALSGLGVEPVLAPLPVVDDAIRRGYRGLVTAVMQRPFGVPALTQPNHRLDDELPIELRHRALLELLIAKGVIAPDEYARELRRLAGERDG
jgi:hypothetical protein